MIIPFKMAAEWSLPPGRHDITLNHKTQATVEMFHAGSKHTSTHLRAVAMYYIYATNSYWAPGARHCSSAKDIALQRDKAKQSPKSCFHVAYNLVDAH